MMKIAHDLKWMNSGPQAGLQEIALPALQSGSSIMPGKANPVIPEEMALLCIQVIGNGLTVTLEELRPLFNRRSLTARGLHK